MIAEQTLSIAGDLNFGKILVWRPSCLATKISKCVLDNFQIESFENAIAEASLRTNPPRQFKTVYFVSAKHQTQYL